MIVVSWRDYSCNAIKFEWVTGYWSKSWSLLKKIFFSMIEARVEDICCLLLLICIWEEFWVSEKREWIWEWYTIPIPLICVREWVIETLSINVVVTTFWDEYREISLDCRYHSWYLKRQVKNSNCGCVNKVWYIKIVFFFFKTGNCF